MISKPTGLDVTWNGDGEQALSQTHVGRTTFVLRDGVFVLNRSGTTLNRFLNLVLVRWRLEFFGESFNFILESLASCCEIFANSVYPKRGDGFERPPSSTPSRREKRHRRARAVPAKRRAGITRAVLKSGIGEVRRETCRQHVPVTKRYSGRFKGALSDRVQDSL